MRESRILESLCPMSISARRLRLVSKPVAQGFSPANEAALKGCATALTRSSADAENHSIPVVRQSGRRSCQFLHIHLQELEGWQSESVRRRRTWAEGHRHDGVIQ